MNHNNQAVAEKCQNLSAINFSVVENLMLHIIYNCSFW